MQTYYEITGDNECKLIPETVFTPPITTTDLIFSTFGHASTYLFSTLAATDLFTLAAIFNNDQSEPKPLVIIYFNKSRNTVIATTTQFFKPVYANNVVQLLSAFLIFSRAIILDSLPTLSYQLGKYKDNVLIWVGTNNTVVPDKRIEQIDPGEVISGIAGAFLIMSEMCSRPCYVFIGVMQEYLVGRDTLKTYGVLGELIEFLKLATDEQTINFLITNTNNKLASNSFT